MYKSRITLSISQIAPLIGLDNYNNFPRIFCEIWKQYNPVDFNEYQVRVNKEGFETANASDYNTLSNIDVQYGIDITKQVRELNNNKNKTSGEMVKMQSNITDYINNQDVLNNVQKEELVKKVCSITNKNHGINNEDVILNEFCKLTDKQLLSMQGWIEIPLVNSTIGNWFIVGKYDAITTEDELVEAKMRQKCLFKKVRDYENVQVQLYLHGLEIKIGYLVEAFTSTKRKQIDGEVSMQIDIHEIKYNDEYVNEVVLDRLRKFVEFFELVIVDDNKKMELIKGDINRKVYKSYVENYLEIFDF